MILPILLMTHVENLQHCQFLPKSGQLPTSLEHLSHVLLMKVAIKLKDYKYMELHISIEFWSHILKCQYDDYNKRGTRQEQENPIKGGGDKWRQIMLQWVDGTNHAANQDLFQYQVSACCIGLKAIRLRKTSTCNHLMFWLVLVCVAWPQQ